MMKAEGRSRAITIFHRVLEIPVERRMDFLAEACAGDSALRIELQELLVMLVEETGQNLVKVTDFGLARSVQPVENFTHSFAEVVGTPSYMAPEQFRGQ
jgi:serine/threonine protein kinase